MKETKRLAKRVFAAFLGFVTLFGGFSATAFATDANPQAPANGEKVYSVDPFDAEHSAGYFCVSNSTGIGCNAGGYWGDSSFSGSNTSRSDGIYIDHYEGACMNGTYLDVREYVWMADGYSWSISQDGSVGVQGTADVRVMREFHFYEGGTLDSNDPKEVSFSGVMRLQDLDIEEGYTFNQGLIGVWLNNPTNVTKRSSNTWKGTWENGNDGVHAEREMLWVEVEGSPSKPLIITYWGNVGHGSGLNYFGSSVTYSLVENSKNALPDGAVAAVGTHCATYAQYSLMPAEVFIRYEFSGWYNDRDLTSKSDDTVMLSSDMSFYGTYIKVAGLIETEASHGTITPTDECFAYGGDKVIEYAPEEGYLLESVIVDGQKMDITEYPSSYTFSNVQEDHQISVNYVEASMDKDVAIKESDCIDNYDDGKSIDGMVIKDGDVVTYTISFENPTGAERMVVISDVIPTGAEYMDGSANSGGTYENGMLRWTLNVPAHTSGCVSFDCLMQDEAQGSIVKNQAKVTFKALTENGTEKDVTLQDVTVSPVLDTPVKYVLDNNGKDITDKIVNDGAVLTYSIELENPAATEKIFTVTDEIPAGVELVVGTISDGGTASDGVVTWTVTLKAKAEEKLTFSVKVKKPTKALTKIYNQAMVIVDATTKNTEAKVAPDGETRTATYVMDDPVKMTLNADGKIISHDAEGYSLQTVKQSGDIISYQISFQNPAEDTRTFTVTDKLPEGVAYINADHNGSYDEDTHAVSWKVKVGAAQEKTVTVQVEIQEDAEGSILKNHATVDVDEAQKDTNEVETPVIASPEKDVKSSLDSDSINTFPVQIGENLYYTISYENPSDYGKTAIVTDQLPEGVKFISADNGGSYDSNTHTVIWTIDTEAHAEVTVSVKAKVLASASGTDLNNQASVRMDEANVMTITSNGDSEDETTSNFVCGKYVLNADGDAIDKTVVSAGDVVTYKITYKNSSDNVRSVVIKDVLPQDVTYVEASEGGNVQSIVHGQTVLWELDAEPRTETFVTVSVKVSDALKGQAFANSATVELSDAATEQSKTVTTNQVTNYVLEDVVKSVLNETGKKNMDLDFIEAGSILQYRITVKNPATSERTFTITDNLPEGTEFVSADHDGKCEDGMVSWTVTLESGESVTVAFFAKVSVEAKGATVQNIAEVSVDAMTARSNWVKTYVKKGTLDGILDSLAGEDDSEVEETGSDDTVVTENTETATDMETTEEKEGASSIVKDGPKTGDDSNLGLWLALAGIAGIASLGFGLYAGCQSRKRKKDKE